MGIFKRIRNIFKREPSEGKISQTAGIINVPSSGGIIWSPMGYENFAKETYLKNIIAFRAIDEVAKSVASVTWKEFKALPKSKVASIKKVSINTTEFFSKS